MANDLKKGKLKKIRKLLTNVNHYIEVFLLEDLITQEDYGNPNFIMG